MSTPNSPAIDMALEVVVIPVSDVDRAKRFYGSLEWRLDADIAYGKDSRLVQFTPPGSACSIHFGNGVTAAAPGSEGGLYLVVSDIQAAQRELAGCGVDVSEVFHRSPAREELVGADPQRRSYSSFASFRDPDGNRWLVQEVTARLPGRLNTEVTTSNPRRNSRGRCIARRRRMVNTRSERVKKMRTGRTGMRSTSSASKPICRCLASHRQGRGLPLVRHPSRRLRAIPRDNLLG
jgi:catechol 2,3-dioxygenase-like lactoylglutathione lyase family enzyme